MVGCAGLTHYDFVVPEHCERWNTSYPVACGECGGIVDVHLQHDRATGHLFGRPLDVGRNRSTWTAPFGPKINENRDSSTSYNRVEASHVHIDWFVNRVEGGLTGAALSGVGKVLWRHSVLALTGGADSDHVFSLSLGNRNKMCTRGKLSRNFYSQWGGALITQILGGTGLFLIGMVLVTDGLRGATGDSLRQVLLRFTGGRVKSLMAGAAITAAVQSSSIATVATIGFVRAGVLTFAQSLGLIFGANIGTTVTGWIVALLGLEFGVSSVAFPLVGIGALVRLFFRGRVSHFGLAAAGFGIIFVGIDVLQSGMSGLAEYLAPHELPPDSWGGRMLLVLIGVALTTVMQSSSAAVTTALAALHSGTISLQQAAAIVIGINIGTTVTAGLAAVGTSTGAKRTALAHFLFNGLTGVVAFAILPVFVWAVGEIGAQIAPGDATVLLSAFHTAFNVFGVILILPFWDRFATMVTRVVPERGPHLTRLLDYRVVGEGAVATEAVRQTVIEISGTVFESLGRLLNEGAASRRVADALDAAFAALNATDDYIASLRFAAPLSEVGHRRHMSTIHALDHLRRLLDLSISIEPVSDDASPDLDRVADTVAESIASACAWTRDSERAAPRDSLRHAHEAIVESRQQLRTEFLEQTARARISPGLAGARLERLRWLGELAYHSWRLVDRLHGERKRKPVEPSVPPKMDELRSRAEPEEASPTRVQEPDAP